MRITPTKLIKCNNGKIQEGVWHVIFLSNNAETFRVLINGALTHSQTISGKLTYSQTEKNAICTVEKNEIFTEKNRISTLEKNAILKENIYDFYTRKKCDFYRNKCDFYRKKCDFYRKKM